MNVGSLFSGVGGIELGFEREGFTTKWFVECEPYAQTILRKHYPNATIYDDVKEIDWRNVPAIDVLTGGFPCQDISNAGKRIGITGSRSSLWKHYLEAIRILRPKYIVAENVSALIDRGLNVVLADLASIGYDAEWHCIPASSVGAPHRRDRIFILAYPNSSGCVHGQTEEHSREGKTLNNTWSSCEELDCSSKSSNTDSEGLERQRTARPITNENPAGWWSTEPDVGRVADGVPNRVDRIKCLGNAVVPQQAQVIAKAIKEAEE